MGMVRLASERDVLEILSVQASGLASARVRVGIKKGMKIFELDVSLFSRGALFEFVAEVSGQGWAVFSS